MHMHRPGGKDGGRELKSTGIDHTSQYTNMICRANAVCNSGSTS